MCLTVVAPSADGGLNLTSTFFRWADAWGGFGDQRTLPTLGV